MVCINFEIDTLYVIGITFFFTSILWAILLLVIHLCNRNTITKKEENDANDVILVSNVRVQGDIVV